MYSGTSLTRASGRVMGAHQKLDRVARRHLTRLLKQEAKLFPTAREILYFEGRRGPDAIKIKSPAKDEPWHYYNPLDDDDTQILDIINDHYQKLVQALKEGSRERAAFEASWLAHSIVDGLTPAHHYPYEERLIELRGGQGIETRTTIKEKLFVPGLTRREKIKNNWQVWGSKGLITTHMMFEFGVAALIAPLSFSDTVPKKYELERMADIGAAEYFKQTAREIVVLEMYTRYQEKGWTPKLAYDVRHKLTPLILRCLALTWYQAMRDSNIIKPTDS